MAEPLRPLSTGELLDRTFALYKRNFALFVGISLPAPTLYLFLQLIRVEWLLRHPASRARYGLLRADILWMWLALLLSWFVGLAFTHPATIRAVSALHLGQPIGIRESYRALRGRVLRVIGIVMRWSVPILLGAIAGIIAVTVVVAVFEFSSASMRLSPLIWSMFIGSTTLLIMALGVLLVWGRYALAIQACVVEDLGVSASLRRSKFLAAGSVLRITVVYLIFVAISMVVSYSLGYAARYALLSMTSTHVLGIMTSLNTFISGALTGPLATIALSLLYYDERVRKEGFDLQMMIAGLESPVLANAAAGS